MVLMIDERTHARVRARFFDFDEEAAPPSEIVYTIHDVQSGEAIRTATAVPPAAVVEIILTEEDNRIVNSQNRSETRVVTLRADSAAGQAHSELEYQVRNLRYVPIGG